MLRVYLLVVGVAIVREFLAIFGAIPLRGSYDLYPSLLMYVVLLLGLVYEYVTLTALLREYHAEHYQTIRKPMLFFFIFELSGLVICFGTYFMFAIIDNFPNILYPD